MNRPDFQQAIVYALTKLANELPPTRHYHSLWHTEGDVMPAAARLAQALQLAEDDQRLLQVAASYHDIGFLRQSKEHEMHGSNMVKEILPRFGFSQEQIGMICGIIMATRLPQSPTTLLEQIMADADLDSLGRDDYFATANNLRRELAEAGNGVSDKQWHTGQLNFLSSHRYFTTAASALRDEGKRQNIAALQQILRDLKNKDDA